MKKEGIIVIIALIVVILCVVGGYFFYFYKEKCSDETCFKEALAKCQRATYVSEGTETIIAYDIKGVTNEKCEVNVKILQVKKGLADLALLDGKDMDCFTDLGVVTLPEKDIKTCHGLLKEEMQGIIIKRMYSQIVENIGKINQEITNVL